MLPLAAFAVVFLVANRQSVALSFNPFSDQSGFLTSPALPLWLWLMVMLFIGFGLGIFGMWSSAKPSRQKLRDLKLEVKQLNKQLALREENPSSSEHLPVLKSE